jgi:flagellar basal-body rod protein FlgB
MDAITAAVMLKALDGLSVRQTATAQNIANAGTPNYQPVRVTFEDALKAAGRDRTAIDAVQPKIEAQAPSLLGPDMRLDLELATAASTAGRYGTVVELLGRQLQLQAIAISGGR